MTTAIHQTREPYPDPAYPGNPATAPTRKIKFLHPGYKDEANILLQFDAYDAESGIHYHTAHTACAIVANNRWDGYFSTDIDGRQRVEPSSMDDSLQDDAYYFQVPEGEPTIHSFYTVFQLTRCRQNLPNCTHFCRLAFPSRQAAFKVGLPADCLLQSNPFTARSRSLLCHPIDPPVRDGTYSSCESI